jgi:hypothetical protein
LLPPLILTRRLQSARLPFPSGIQSVHTPLQALPAESPLNILDPAHLRRCAPPVRAPRLRTRPLPTAEGTRRPSACGWCTRSRGRCRPGEGGTGA